jgi:hypothetical protein
MSATIPYTELLLANYRDTLGWIREAVADIPTDRFADCLPTAPNHPAWTLGHLACSAAFLGQLLEEPFGLAFDGEKPRFGAGSKPVALGDYGAKDALIARLVERHAQLTAAVEAKAADYFTRPSPERLRAIAPTIGHLGISILASHEHYHLAQIVQWKG